MSNAPCVLAADSAAKGDFWFLDSATLTWREQTRDDVKGDTWPAQRHSAAFAAVDSDTIIIFGGVSAGEWRVARRMRPFDSDHRDSRCLLTCTRPTRRLDPKP